MKCLAARASLIWSPQTERSEDWALPPQHTHPPPAVVNKKTSLNDFSVKVLAGVSSGGTRKQS